MNVRLLVLSSRRRILVRSLGYALGCGSAVGALTVLVVALVGAVVDQNLGLLPLTLVLAPIGAAVGAAEDAQHPVAARRPELGAGKRGLRKRANGRRVLRNGGS